MRDALQGTSIAVGSNLMVLGVLDRFDALVCRVFHRARWQTGIDRYFGHGLAVDFTCSLCDRSWYWYDYEHLWRYRARRQQEALECAARNAPKLEEPGA